jgi:hypothetical protein
VSDSVTVFFRPGDPASEATLRYLDQRGITYTKRDVLSAPSATAILFGRLGKVVVPVVQVGERLLVGHDPVQLARFLPRPESEEQHVAFGATVRTVTNEIAAAKALPATYGVEVGQVKPGSAAEAAGIESGDVITGIGPYTVNGGADQFRGAVSLRQPGDTMMLTLWRDANVIEVAVVFPAGIPVPDPASASPEAPAEDAPPD